MKKLALVVLAVMLTVGAFSQGLRGFRPDYVIPDTSVNFSQRIDVGDKIRVTSTGMEYILKIGVNRGVNMHWVLLDTNRYTLTTSSITNITNIANTAIDTALVAFTNTPNTYSDVQTFGVGTLYVAIDTNVATVVGKIVFKSSDKHLYMCWKTSAGKKWIQIDNMGDIVPITNNQSDLGSDSRMFAEAYVTNAFLTNVTATTVGASDVNAEVLKIDAAGDTTVTAALGKIVFKSSDKHFYGCVSLTGVKWKALDN